MQLMQLMACIRCTTLREGRQKEHDSNVAQIVYPITNGISTLIALQQLFHLVIEFSRHIRCTHCLQRISQNKIN